MTVDDSGLLCLCDVFRALINSLVGDLVLFQIVIHDDM